MSNTDALLMQALNFTEEDLDYNRRGEFSPRQLATKKAKAMRLRRWRTAIVLIGLVITVLSIVTGSALVVSLSCFLVLVFYPTLFPGSMAQKVTTPQGAAKLLTVNERGVPTPALIIEDTLFCLPKQVYDLLEDGVAHAIYYLQVQFRHMLSIQRNQILSLERVESVHS